MNIKRYSYLIVTGLLITLIIPCFYGVDTGEPITDVFFPKRTQSSDNYREALITGKLEIKNKCLGFKQGETVFMTLVNWPSYYNLMRKGESVFISKKGRFVMEIGGYVKIGGSPTGSVGGAIMSNGVTCVPPYWEVGGTPSPSFKNIVVHKLRAISWMWFFKTTD